MPLAILKSKLVLGEGKDEELFMSALHQHLGITDVPDVQVLSYDGKLRLPVMLKAIQGATGFGGVSSIGKVRDADRLPAESVFSSVCSTMGHQDINLPVPTSLLQLARRPGNPASRFLSCRITSSQECWRICARRRFHRFR